MSNVYRIGVNIAMAGNSSQFLGVLGRELLGVHTQVGQLQQGFSRLKLAIGGALAVGAGVGILKSMQGPLDEARKFQMEVTKFGNFGLGPERTREAAEFAKQMKVTGSTYIDNMKRMSEAQGVFRESGLGGEAALRGAKLAAPMLAKIDFAGAALDSESRARQNTQALAMLRFVEMRGGVNSPEKFNAIANAGFKAIQSSGGNINWEQLRQFQARAGVAGQGLTDEALFGKLEPVIGELKGSTAGFALRTAFNRLNGVIKLPNQVAHELVSSGVWDGSKVQWNSQGGIKSFKGNPLIDQPGFSSDPVAFYEKYIMPMYAKRGLDQNARARENSMIFGSTGGALFSLVDRQLPAIHHSVEAQRAAKGVDAAYAAAGGTLNGKIIDLRAKEANLQLRLGEAILPMAVKGLSILVPALEKLTDWVGKHPKQVEFFAKAAVVVGTALIGLGAAAVGVAAFAAVAAGGAVAGWVVGIGALTGAAVAVVALNWEKVTGAASAVWSFISQIWKAAAFIIEHPFTAFLPTGNRPLSQAELDRQGAFAPHGVKAGDTTFDFTPRFMTQGRKSDGLPPKGGSSDQAVGHVYLDAKKVGRVLSGQMGAAMDAFNAGTGRPDLGAGLPAAGGSGHR